MPTYDSDDWLKAQSKAVQIMVKEREDEARADERKKCVDGVAFRQIEADIRADERRKCKQVIETEGYEASPEVKKIIDEAEQRGFDNGKKLSKEFHCAKHGWACERCEDCVNDARTNSQAELVIKAIQEKEMVAPDFLLKIVEDVRASERNAITRKLNSQWMVHMGLLPSEEM
jgi:hypothetical protein